MQPFCPASSPTKEHTYSWSLFFIDATLLITMFLLPNLLMGSTILSLAKAASPAANGTSEHIIVFMHALNSQCAILWVTVNLSLCALLLLLRRHVFQPLHGVAKQLHELVPQPATIQPARYQVWGNIRNLTRVTTRMAQLAQEYYVKHREASDALAKARQLIQQINTQYDVVLHSTHREMVAQYQTVLAYANYLEERIAKQAGSPDLRYDFDDVSESGFNLKLIAGALNLIENANQQQRMDFNLPEMIEYTLVALSPSLDRRAMKLTTVEVDSDVSAHADPAIVSHALWMLLLGTIRYAAEESTLRLRCLRSRDQTRALISIVVSELSTRHLTEDARSLFLLRQMQHLTPHMFAETIRIHANMQLVELLMNHLDGQLTVLPLTSHSCEICLDLPAHPAR
jgi:hypothetical protein